MAAPPVQPAPGGPGRWRVEEQAPYLGDGERDHPGVCGRGLIGSYRRGHAGVSAVAEQGGGDSADGQGGHDQDGVAGDRLVKADLRLIEAEAVLAELEAFFNGPLLMPVK